VPIVCATGCRYLAFEREKGYVEGGWNYTGDAYWIDEGGHFVYRARTDDMIISAGYNVAGPEVEDALLLHPAVAECGVIGAPQRAAWRGRQGVRGAEDQSHWRRCHGARAAGVRQAVDRTTSIRARSNSWPAAHGNRQAPALPAAPAVARQGGETVMRRP
jgi:acyl-CoA synthetase (AMP-forming)/AMP-acid ligase II